MALKMLSEQATLHAQDPGMWREGYVSMAQLRDDVLRDEFSAARRKKLWERVQKKVEGNSNVRPMVREGRTGDVGRMWEWVGAVCAIESPPRYREDSRERKRKSGGYSELAGEKLIEPRSMVKNEEVSGGRWEEGRSYY